MAQRPVLAQDLLFIELHDHTQTQHTRQDSSGRVISPTQRPLPDNTQHSHDTFMSSTGFEPTIPASERRQTHALDRADTGIGGMHLYRTKICLTIELTSIKSLHSF